MESYLYVISGFLITLLTASDLIYTTFAPRGSGMVSGFMTTIVWRCLLGLQKATGKRVFFQIAGPIIVIFTLFGWVMLLWLGNFLVFLVNEHAVISSSTRLPASNLERFYYTGYLLSTMGNGDFNAGTDILSVYSAFISFTGLILITTAISYMVPILSAVTQRRALSIKLASIGSSPQQIIIDNWNGKDCKKLTVMLEGLNESIALQGQMHLSYPVLQYFHHADKVTALLPNIAKLDELLTLLILYLPDDAKPDKQHLLPLRKAITTFLKSLNIVTLHPKKADVPQLDISELQKNGIPLQHVKQEDLEKLNYRRRTLKAMVDYDGWKWKDICGEPFDERLDLNSLT